MEAASGFEPLHRGFADPRLNHLATPPEIIMERKTRFELATSSLARRRSTAELLPHAATLSMMLLMQVRPFKVALSRLKPRRYMKYWTYYSKSVKNIFSLSSPKPFAAIGMTERLRMIGAVCPLKNGAEEEI